jgi:hypothetical protein
MKIESDTLEEMDHQKTVTRSDLSPVVNKIESVIFDVKKIIDKQKRAMIDENKSYEVQHEYCRYLVGLFVFQILLVLIVGGVQLYFFRKYLIYNKVI